MRLGRIAPDFGAPVYKRHVSIDNIKMQAAGLLAQRRVIVTRGLDAALWTTLTLSATSNIVLFDQRRLANPRTRNMEKLPAFVYIAHEPAKRRAKFGFSGDLPRRLYDVRSWLKFDFLTSRRLRMPSWRDACLLETRLKAAFSSHRLSPDPRERWCFGWTEVYNEICLYDALEFLAACRETVSEGWTVESIPIEWRCPPGCSTVPPHRNQERGMHTPGEIKRRGLQGL